MSLNQNTGETVLTLRYDPMSWSVKLSKSPSGDLIEGETKKPDAGMAVMGFPVVKGQDYSIEFTYKTDPRDTCGIE